MASDSTRAVHWMRIAAEAALMLDLEGERRAWRLAFEADPTAYPAQSNLLWHTVDEGERAILQSRLRELADSGVDSAICLITEMEMEPRGWEAVFGALRRLEAEGHESVCLAEKLARWGGSMTPKDEWRGAELRYARRAAESATGPANIVRYARLLAREGRFEDARRQLRHAIRGWDDPLARLGPLMGLAEVLRLAGDSTRSVALISAVRTAVARDGRPGLRWHFLWNLEQSHRARDRIDSLPAIRRERIRLAREHGHWHHELEDVYTLAAHTGELDSEGRLALLNRGVHLADSVGWTEKIAYVRYARGAHFRERGDIDRAERDLLTALAAARRLGHPAIEVEIFHHLLHVHEAREEYERAAELAGEYIAAAERHMIPGARVMSRRDAGLVRWKAGWHAAADSAFADMVRAIESHRVHYTWAGEYYERIGRLEDALEAYRLASREDPAHEERRLALAGMSRVFEVLGHPDSALATARRHDAETMFAASFPLLPEVMVRQGRVEEALAIGRSFVAEGRERAQLPFLVDALLGLSELRLQAARFEAAVHSAREADSLARVLDQRERAAEARILEARALAASSRSGEALGRLDGASRLLAASPRADLDLELAWVRGRALGSRGEFGAALAAYGVAADAAERIAAELRHDPGRSRFRHVHQSPYDAAVDLLLANGEDGLLPGPPSANRLAEWLQRRKATSLEVASRSPPARVEIEALRERIPHRAALLDYVVTEVNTAVLVVRSSDATVVRLPISPRGLEQLVDRFERPFTTTYLGHIDLARTPFSTDTARELHRALIAPILRHLDDIESLYVVPDGPLHRVPFAALVPDPGGGERGEVDDARDGDVGGALDRRRFLLDRFVLTYLPASQYLPDARDRESFRHPTRVAAVGIDAPGWDRELEAVTATWGAGRSIVLEGPLATETSVRTLRPADILHFVAHAEANRRDPLASHLRLAADGVHDGYLHFNEIAATAFDAQLVVLSACESTGGAVFRGEGTMSLARAFLASGARSVAASLWPIGPSAAELMARFHGELAAGRSSRVALRAAQRALRDDPNTSHPFHWAAFVLIEGGRHASASRSDVEPSLVEAVGGGGSPVRLPESGDSTGLSVAD